MSNAKKRTTVPLKALPAISLAAKLLDEDRSKCPSIDSIGIVAYSALGVGGSLSEADQHVFATVKAHLFECARCAADYRYLLRDISRDERDDKQKNCIQMSFDLSDALVSSQETVPPLRNAIVAAEVSKTIGTVKHGKLIYAPPTPAELVENVLAVEANSMRKADSYRSISRINFHRSIKCLAGHPGEGPFFDALVGALSRGAKARRIFPLPIGHSQQVLDALVGNGDLPEGYEFLRAHHRLSEEFPGYEIRFLTTDAEQVNFGMFEDGATGTRRCFEPYYEDGRTRGLTCVLSADNYVSMWDCVWDEAISAHDAQFEAGMAPDDTSAP
ncbi:MAG: hypothetical protein ACE37K_15880 [Planctomycetota bacterium]